MEYFLYSIRGDKIKYKSVFFICMIIAALLCLGAVSANDLNQTDNIQAADEENSQIVSAENDADKLQSENSDILQASAKSTAKKITANSRTTVTEVFTLNSTYCIQILDDKGKGISKKPVQITFNKKVTNLTTNRNGYIFYELGDTKGTYKLSYLFKVDGYTKTSGSKIITIVGDTVSKIKGSNYIAYKGVKNPYMVTLTVDGIPVPNKQVVFNFKGKTYKKTTNSKGQAFLNINCGKGTYAIKYKFYSIKNAHYASGTSKISVRQGMPTNIIKQTDRVYIHNTASVFKIKHVDARNNPIAGKIIVFKLNGKVYKVKTDKNGMASINIKLNQGKYSLKVAAYYAAKTYKKSVKTFTIKVKSSGPVNNGFWLFGADMYNVDLKTMAKYGVNQIFLNFYAVELHGKSAVASFATQAKKLGIKVHIWMQAFYSGGNWISPVNDDGSYKYSYFNSVIKEAKSYAQIDGVAGIHFDYLRFPGTAYKHSNGVEAINYFTKKVCNELHALNPKLLVTAAVMPEVSSNVYYYGQDIPTLTKYLDAIVPMIYKGNYGQTTSWIKSVTSTFVSQSNGAQVWTGLQGYRSDSNVNKLPASELKNDAVNAGYGGADGIIVFRYSLFNLFDFDTL